MRVYLAYFEFRVPRPQHGILTTKLQQTHIEFPVVAGIQAKNSKVWQMQCLKDTNYVVVIMNLQISCQFRKYLLRHLH